MFFDNDKRESKDNDFSKYRRRGRKYPMNFNAIERQN